MNLREKLIEIRKCAEYLQKTETGYNYKYVGGASILAAIKGKMNDLGVLLFPSIPVNEDETGPAIRTVRVEEYHAEKDGKTHMKFKNEYVFSAFGNWTWLDSESDESMTVPWFFAGAMHDPAMAVGSALTYQERYFLMKYFQIATDEDNPEAWDRKRKLAEDAAAKAESKPAPEPKPKTKPAQNKTQKSKNQKESALKPVEPASAVTAPKDTPESKPEPKEAPATEPAKAEYVPEGDPVDPERIKKVMEVFAHFDVTLEMLEKYVGCDAIAWDDKVLKDIVTPAYKEIRLGDTQLLNRIKGA